METMNDEERYPTYVPPPEDKQVVSQLENSKPAPDIGNAGLKSTKIFKIRRTTFWLLLVLVVVAVAGVVGGAVGGSLAAKKSGNTVAGTDGATQTTSNSYASTVSTSTVAITTDSPIIQAIAASQVLDANGDPNIGVYFQEASSNQITYRIYTPALGFGSRQNLSLSFQPKQGTPLAATAYISPLNAVYLDLFYLDSGNNIIDVAMICTPGSPSCPIATQNIIYGNNETGVSSSSGLCALYLRDPQQLRVFYHDSNNIVKQLVKQFTLGSWYLGTFPSAKARNGSSIACSSAQQAASVFFVDASSSSLYIVSKTPEDWGSPNPLNTSTLTDWEPSAWLTATARSDPDVLRQYFIGKSKIMYEVTNASGAWVQGHSPTWSAPESIGGPIAAIGWGDQVRLYYTSDKRIMQAAMRRGFWSQGVFDALF